MSLPIPDDVVRLDYKQLSRMLDMGGLLFVWSDEFDCWLNVYKRRFLETVDREAHYLVRRERGFWFVWSDLDERAT